MKDYCDRCDVKTEVERDEDSGRNLCSKCFQRMMQSFEHDMIIDAKIREHIRSNPNQYDYGMHEVYQV